MVIASIAGGVCYLIVRDARVVRNLIFDAWFSVCDTLNWSLRIDVGLFVADAVMALVGILVAACVYQLMTAHFGPGSAEGETRCRKCGYILRGISEPRCPECGERI